MRTKALLGTSQVAVSVSEKIITARLELQRELR